MLRQLKSFFGPSIPSELRDASKAAYKVLYRYYQKSLTNHVACVITILDPRYKDQVFKYLEDIGTDRLRVHKKAVERFKSTYNRYVSRQSKIDTYQRSVIN